MAIGYIASSGGGGGTLSSDVTAKKENVLIGTSTVTSDSDDAIVEGTMPNIGKVTQTLEVNGSYTIPKGYHDGTGKITQNLNTKGATTYYATTSDQTIATNQYLIGAQTIKKITTNLAAENIKPGVTVNVNNGNSNVFSVTGNMPSKTAATYYVTTSDQTIASGQYLSGAQTIKKITQTNLTAGNIKNGTTVSINNGSSNVWSVTGTFAGNIKHMHVDAVYVPGDGTYNDQGPNAMQFTMPENGVVHYSGFSYKSNDGGSGGNHIHKNGVLIDNRDLSAGDGWTYRGTMVMKSFNANKGDVIRIECSAGAVGTVFTLLDAVINY